MNVERKGKQRKRTKTKTRSLLQRAEAIFKIINDEDGTFPKSKLKDANLSPDAAEKWLDLIFYIQNQPKIRLIKTRTNKKRHTLVERVEGKFSLMSIKYFLDESLPIEKRLRSLEAYADSVLVRQRLIKSD